ncbi:MAG: asparagine synthase-related protein [Desulfovibrionaceae bacterium]
MSGIVVWSDGAGSVLPDVLAEALGLLAGAGKGENLFLLWDGHKRLEIAGVEALHSLHAEHGWKLGMGVIGPVGVERLCTANHSHALAVDGVAFDAMDMLSETVSGTDARSCPAAALLGLLRRKGVPILQQLAGSCALALLDVDAGSLCLARDRYGRKPLYYHHAGSAFLAGSEPKALRRVLERTNRLGGTWRVDPSWLGGVLISGDWFTPEDGTTPWTGVRQVRPGTALRLDLRSGTTEVLRTNLLEQFVDLPSDGARLCNDVHAAIRVRIPEQGLLAVPLTGGPGPTAVAALAAGIAGPQRVRLYALETSAIDWEWAQDLARDLGLSVQGVPWPEHVQVEARRTALVRFLELPLTEPFPFFELDLLCAAMARDGATVALSGSGGRAVLGVRHDLAVQSLESLIRKRRPVRAALLGAILAEAGQGLTDKMGTGLAASLSALAPRTYRATQEQARFELLAHHSPVLDTPRMLEVFRNCLAWRDLTSLRRMQVHQLTRGSLPGRFAAEDRVAAAHGVELRSPLLDQRLTRYLRLPPSQRCSGSLESPLLRSCLPAGISDKVRLQTGPHEPVAHLAALPARDDKALRASPLVNVLFPELSTLFEDLERHRQDARFRGLPTALDALAEWARECAQVM